MAKGSVRVTGAHGTRLIPRVSDIGGGVLQGDPIPLLYPTIALAYAPKWSGPGGPTNILGLPTDAPSYAGDAALPTIARRERRLGGWVRYARLYEWWLAWVPI